MKKSAFIMRFMKKILCLILALLIAHIAEKTVAGSDTEVVDGDSLQKNLKRIRLIGIDAPEYFQECEDENGKKYMCGQEAKAYLESLIENGRAKGDKLICRSEGVDRYKRELSVCSIGNVELNFEMVKAGYAVSYKYDRYHLAEKRAKQRKKGIWRGKFMRPEIYRAIKREKEKENINK